MGRRVDVDDLVGSWEIAQRFGLSNPTTINQWARRDINFPKPVVTLVMGHLYSWREVYAWAKQTKRLS